MWATWCGGCVSAIPHLNDLAEKFQDKPVVFLSVTDEDPTVVEEFLRTRPIRGLVGVAHAESPYKRYDVDGVPATFLIDRAGKIAGSTDPQRLSGSMIKDLLAGRPLPPIELTIRRARGNSIMTSIGRNSLEMSSAHLDSILAQVW